MFDVLILLFFLYIIQGIPYGFQSRFLPIYLRAKSNMSLSSLGIMKMLYFPWLLKPFYSPLLEKRYTKQRWLQYSITGLLIVCLLLIFMGHQGGGQLNLQLLCICLFAFNLMAASQDIAVDGLALSLLTESSDLSKANVAQVVGYKFGAIIGGGILLSLAEWLPWEILFLILSTIYAISIVLVTLNQRISQLAIIEQADFDNYINTDGDKKLAIVVSFRKYVKMIKTILCSPGTGYMLVCVLVYKLGEQGAMNMLPLYLVDRGYALAEIGFWTGIVGQVASIFGSSCAGYLQSVIKDSVRLLYTLCIVRAFLIALITLLVWEWISLSDIISPFYLSVLLMNVCLFISGSITTVTFTLMMLNSQHCVTRSNQTTHYTFLATAEVLGKLMFSWIGGVLTDMCGYAISYIIYTILAIIASLYIIIFQSHFHFGKSKI